MQQQTIFIGKARMVLLSGILTVACFLFAGVNDVTAQNWVSPSEATTLSRQEAASILQGLQAFTPGTLEYEQQVRKMNLYNNVVSMLKVEPNVATALELAIRSAYAPNFSTDPKLIPVKEETDNARKEATDLLTN